MSRSMFVNLPVKDLPRSVDFFTELGFDFDPQFTDEKATCMVLSDQAFVMLLTDDFFASFTEKPIAQASSSTEAILGLSAETREEVDDLFARAVAAGASATGDPQDHGFMYSRAFEDLDGHQWELIWMDRAAIAQ